MCSSARFQHFSTLVERTHLLVLDTGFVASPHYLFITGHILGHITRSCDLCVVVEPWITVEDIVLYNDDDISFLSNIISTIYI